MKILLKLANLSLLILFPVAWFAPLMKSGLWPIQSLREYSIMDALQGVWKNDVYLALLMTFFAVFAPYIKIISTALIQFNLMSPRLMGPMQFIGKLAMADIYAIAIFIVIYTGIDVAGISGQVETSWGLYLFTGNVIASILISHFTRKSLDG
ncbi:MAG: paraquat-inducible membrane protein A [Alphaproteobacteria bacterium]|nr:paraquat-inducible membrane protein A [Alphaproteobacteria bacterium]